MNDELLRITEKTLSKKESGIFRQGVRAFSGLSELDLVRRSGLLPTSRVTPPALIVGHINHAAMSDEISAFRRSLVKISDIRALDFSNRLAVSSGLLDGITDTLEDLVKTFADLPMPESVGMASVREDYIDELLTRVRCMTDLPDPRLPPVRRAWEHLRAQARKMGCETKHLWALAQCAEKRDLRPSDLTPASAELLLHNLKTVDKNNFRRGCEQFDAYFDHLTEDLLPTEQLEIRRLPPAPPKPPKSPKVENPVHEAWGSFNVNLRNHGWSNADIGHKLSVLRGVATRLDLCPDDITDSRVAELRANSTRKALAPLNRAIKVYFLLKQDMNLNPRSIDLPPVRWRSHGGVPEEVSGPLERYIEEMNFAPPSQRGLRVAVGALSDAIDEREMCWQQVLSADLNSIDWRNHAYQQNIHIAKIQIIREWFSLPWTAEWHALQWAISRAGISAINSPVPKILKYTEGRNPADLNLQWAKETDRDLRSTIKNPPHGRADLALTLCRNLRMLDGMWSVPALAESGLLPTIIGDVRPKDAV